MYTRAMAGSPGWARAKRRTGRAETREAIIGAALRLFDERGYIGVRVEDIAREAGVSRATFYKHFAEREEILGELFELLLDGTSAIEEPSPGGDLEAEVVSILSSTMSKMLEDPRLARFVYSLPVRHDAVLPGGGAVPAVFQQVEQWLAAGVADGRVRGDVPVERMLEILGRAFEASMRGWAEHGDDPQAHLRELASIAFGGIRSPSQPSGPRAGAKRR